MQVTETNLRFRLEEGITEAETTILGRWYDAVTNLPRVPDANTKLIVLEKGDGAIPSAQYEIILLGSATEEDGLYTYTGSTRGLDFKGYEFIGNPSRAKVHRGGVIGGTVDVHFLFNTIIATLRGNGEAWTIVRVPTLADRDADITPVDGMFCYVEATDVIYIRIDGKWKVSPCPVFATTAARDTAIPTPTNGESCYVSDDGVFYDFTAGSWLTRGTSTTPNGSETVAGKWEGATLSEQRDKQESGGSGPLVLQPKYTTYDPYRYVPAFLVGSNTANDDYDQWNNITNGSFRIVLDGVAINVGPIDFSSATSMALVASIIETGIRAVTGENETVIWDTDKFIISSADTTPTSMISTTTTSTGVVGTDISGAGVDPWMACNVGTVTAKTINRAAHFGYNLLIGTDGYINPIWIDGNTESAVAGESILAGKFVRLASDGKLYIANNTSIANAQVVGWAISSAASGDIIKFKKEGIYTYGSTLTVGRPYFLDNAGGYTLYVQEDNASVVPVSLGVSLSATNILVSINRRQRVLKSFTTVSAAGTPTQVVVTVGFPIHSVEVHGVGAQIGGTNRVAPMYGKYDVTSSTYKCIYVDTSTSLNGTTTSAVMYAQNAGVSTSTVPSVNGSNNLVLDTATSGGSGQIDALLTIYELI